MSRVAKLWLFLTACIVLLSCREEQSEPQKNVEELNVTSDPTTLARGIYTDRIQIDPHRVETVADSAPVRDLFIGLMAFDAQGHLVPAIAQQWFTQDGKEWLFMLDEWAKWSNDEPVTAQDFVASWQRLVDPRNGSKLAKYLVYMGVLNAREIQSGQRQVTDLGVEAINPNTLKITLNRANFVLPKMLSHVSLLPTYQGKKPEASPILPTNGHYRVAAMSDKTLRLQAVDSKPFFATVKYQALNVAQNADRYDLLENPLSSSRTNIKTLPRECVYYYELNFNDPQLQQKSVRLALQTLFGTLNARAFGIPGDSILPKMWQGNRENGWQPMIIEQLLSQAGITPQNPLRLSLTFDNQSAHVEIANQILRTLGQSDLIKITPKAVDWQTLLQIREARHFQLIRSGWCVDFDDVAEFVRHFHSQSPDNKTGYKNEEVDKLIDAFELDLSETKRLEIAQKIDQILRQDIAVLPLFQQQRRIAVNPTLLGIDSNNASDIIYSKDLTRMPISEEQNEPTHRTANP